MGILRCIGSSASVSGEGGEGKGSGVEVKEEKRRRREERTRRREKREGEGEEEGKSNAIAPSSRVAVTAGCRYCEEEAGLGLGGDAICAVAAHIANGHG
jgi:hypothetical protein